MKTKFTIPFDPGRATVLSSNGVSRSPMDQGKSDLRFSKNQTKLTYIIIGLWTIVQGITLLKNIFIYRALDETVDLGNQLTRRVIPWITAIIFIFFINYSTKHLLRKNVDIKKIPFIHFFIATAVSVLMFAVCFNIVGIFGLNTFQNSSIIKYLMMEIDRLFLIYLLISITTCAHHYFHELRVKESALHQLEKAYRQAEIISLNNEVNPHMISNTLNNIASLISIDITEAKKMISDFAQLLRQNLKSNDTIYTTLYHEQKFLTNYVNLQNSDRERRYRIDFNIPDEIRSAIVPKMILQPLVENAIKHTSVIKQNQLTIVIKAMHKEDFLFIEIRNKVKSTEARKISASGIGTENIAKRLKVLYKNNFQFESFRSNGHFTSLLKIPFRIDPNLTPT